MVQVAWTRSYENDLDDIIHYLEKKSPGAGAGFVSKIEDKLKLLRDFPELGRMLAYRNDPLVRELIVGRYHIIYEIVSSREILLHKIHHSSREKLSLE
jgi:toxin ParE1/3/4